MIVLRHLKSTTCQACHRKDLHWVEVLELDGHKYFYLWPDDGAPLHPLRPSTCEISLRRGLRIMRFIDWPTPYKLDGKPLFWVQIQRGRGRPRMWLADHPTNPTVLRKWHPTQEDV